MLIRLDRTSRRFQSLEGRVAQVRLEQPRAEEPLPAVRGEQQVAQRAVPAQLAVQQPAARGEQQPAARGEQQVAQPVVQERVVRAEVSPWQRLDLVHSFNRCLMSHSHPRQQCCA
jgi:hypothetical protein